MTGLRDRLSLVLVDAQDRALAWWRCRGGHTWLLVLAAQRVWLRCATCGRETPGWDCQIRPAETPDRPGAVSGDDDTWRRAHLDLVSRTGSRRLDR